MKELEKIFLEKEILEKFNLENGYIKIGPDGQKRVWKNGCFWIMAEEKTKQELADLIRIELNKMYYKLGDFALNGMKFKE